MSTIDWNAVAAWIALAISIVTPAASLLLSNIHQRRLKKLELQHQKATEFYRKQCAVFSEYLKHATAHIHAMGGSFFDYTTSYHELFMYVPQEYWPLLISFDRAICSKDDRQIEELFLEVTKILASLLQEQQKRIPV